MLASRLKNTVIRLLLSVSLTSFALPVLSSEVGRYEQIVELNRKVLFLLSSGADNAVATQRDTFISRNYYYYKQQLLEQALDDFLTLPANERAIKVNQFYSFLHSDQVRAADAISFIDLIDNLLLEHSQAPYLSQTELRQLRQLEQQILVIQDTYQTDITELTSALVTRGLELEPWQNYLDFLQTQYTRNDIYEEFNQQAPALEQPAVRGAEDNSKSDLVWGYGIPDKTVVLTFDDGPHNRNTAAILDTLKEFNVKAYFFAVGKNVGSVNGDAVKLSKSSAQLQRALSEGHILANHSFSHPVLTKLSDDKQKKELEDTNTLLKTVSGIDVTSFRPPYGAKNDQLVQLSRETGMRSIMWNIDSKDWADPMPESIVKRVMADLATKKKGILLFHDIHKQTVQALPELLKALDEEGYKVVDIDGNPFDSVNNKKPAEQPTAAPVASQLYGNSWALVIGVNKYRYWPQLSYAVNDAHGVKEVLQNKYGFEEERIFTLLDENASRENITEHLANILSDPDRVKPNDRVFIFYAGHGMTRVLPSGRNLGYIIPFDAELDKFHSKAISMTHLQDFSDMIPAKHVYFVMDSCYSGIALTRSGGRAARSKYLEEIASRQARQILTAGGADQEVADGGANGHSVFTGMLLQGLEGAADLDQNNIITASELGAYVSPRVSENSNQTPAFGNLVGSEGGEFLFELAPVNISDASLSEEERLKAEILKLEKENIILKRQIAELSNTQIAHNLVRGSLEDISQLSLTQRKLKANEHHGKGLKFYTEKDYKNALSELHTALMYNPSNPGITNDYGFVLFRDKQYKQALFWLEKTIELDAKRIPVYLNIADTLVALNQLSEAVPYYQYYLEVYPDSPLKDRVDEFLNARG
ncbi:polysaccharide deacetylase family protein [Reinekea marina]|uniref:Polysaccharide deacetylase family protein n=1 Tax=Reinekea marina TaxID=1310421 RepID=A0ABV7WU85_9GAMM|nr:polysaccharide deacetylase family protein [Reinekea marina]MDN3649294.1 polysaccharide deacetylase family protein [Reinekea marina]